MRRFVPFAMICAIYAYLAWWISESLGYRLNWVGFMVGVAVAAFASFTWFMVDGWWSTMTKPYQAQSVKLDTKQTPIQVLRTALWATVKLSLFIAFAILLVAVMTGFMLGWPAWLSLNP